MSVLKLKDRNGKWGTVPAIDPTPAIEAWIDKNISQETGYVLDASLTMSNAAAPADKTGEIRSAVDSLVKGSYLPLKVIFATAAGWQLVQETGLCRQNSAYRLDKYNVTPGEFIVVDSDDLFQFQNVQSVPASGTSNRIGKTYGTGRYYLTVPNGVQYLIVSTPVSGSTAAVYTMADITHSINPMNPLLFTDMYFRKGSVTAGSETSVLYDNAQYINNQFSAFNAATPNPASGTTGYFAFHLVQNQFIPFLNSGESIEIYLLARVNKAMTLAPHLSSNTTWGPNYYVANGNTISLSPGYNCKKITFTYDHDGTVDAPGYRWITLEGSIVHNDLDAEFTFVRGDSLLGWIGDVAENSGESYDTDLLFWGDSLTAGAGGNGTTFPAVCANQLNKGYLNCGVGGETANTVAARQGGNSILIPAGPVNGTYALNDLADLFGSHANPLRQGNGAGSGNKLIINGYEATLAISQTSSTSTDATYTISGYTGPALTVPTVARFAGSNFTGRIVVIFVGQNGSTFAGLSGVQARMAIIDSMIKQIGHDRYVILGLTSGTSSSRDAEDNQMLAHYGNKFFPTRKLLVDYGLTINGLTATSQDETDIAVGTVPTSLRSDGTHMNAYGYTAIGKMLADKIRSLGYV